ncbi:MAG: hypothetical protein WAQ83_01535, partial [Saprospiraceae bacterium]
MSNNKSLSFLVKNICLPTIMLSVFSLQNGISQEDLPSGKVEVIKNYDAKLFDAEKLPLQGLLPNDDGIE